VATVKVTVQSGQLRVPAHCSAAGSLRADDACGDGLGFALHDHSISWPRERGRGHPRSCENGPVGLGAVRRVHAALRPFADGGRQRWSALAG
jgi:hypothetical protein